MYAYHAAPWSASYDDRDRRSHQRRTKQRVQEQTPGKELEKLAMSQVGEWWSWEDMFAGRGPWAKVKALAREEVRRQQCRRRTGERQPQEMFWGGHTAWTTGMLGAATGRIGGLGEEATRFGGLEGRLAEPRGIAEPTPRTQARQRETGQVPSYAELRTVPRVVRHSPVRPVLAPRTCRAKVGMQPGRSVPAQSSWPPVPFLGPGYPAPVPRAVVPVRVHSPVRPVLMPHTECVEIGIQPGRVVSALRSRPPVRLHSPVRPVPAPRTKPVVRVVSPVRPVPAPRTKPVVRVVSPVRPVPAPRTKPVVRVVSPVRPVPAPRTKPVVRVVSPVRPVPAPRTKPVVRVVSPVRPVPAPRTKPGVRVVSPVRPVPAPRTKPVVRVVSLVRPIPAPRTKPVVRVVSPVRPVPAPRTKPGVRVVSPVRPVPAPRTKPVVRVVSPAQPVPVPPVPGQAPVSCSTPEPEQSAPPVSSPAPASGTRPGALRGGSERVVVTPGAGSASEAQCPPGPYPLEFGWRGRSPRIWGGGGGGGYCHALALGTL
ncbi:unnamed protein product [Coregonus sp. 'balchen']|nr:unnamed protein product [Coregonus sp. 'balchen']